MAYVRISQCYRLRIFLDSSRVIDKNKRLRLNGSMHKSLLPDGSFDSSRVNYKTSTAYNGDAATSLATDRGIFWSSRDLDSSRGLRCKHLRTVGIAGIKSLATDQGSFDSSPVTDKNKHLRIMAYAYKSLATDRGSSDSSRVTDINKHLCTMAYAYKSLATDQGSFDSSRVTDINKFLKRVPIMQIVKSDEI
ncbi:hypothetical protein AVEN_99348-1 [Araneus ventricosus]|uniref:Uncharacterized protein n=1 Tax=Araneus ventricosus TaxID=182803 RepID=A0A4Y2U3L2_ARAVE|nr:hypothetical protein AVEN_99348-1 [Araneus ventricosus]